MHLTRGFSQRLRTLFVAAGGGVAGAAGLEVFPAAGMDVGAAGEEGEEESDLLIGGEGRGGAQRGGGGNIGRRERKPFGLAPDQVGLFDEEAGAAFFQFAQLGGDGGEAGGGGHGKVVGRTDAVSRTSDFVLI